MQRIVILLIVTCLWAEGSVNVTVDRRRIDEGDSITLTVTAKNVSSDPDIILPNIPDFKVVSGPNQSSSTNVQFINGKMTKSATTILTWVLIPTKTGQLMIPAISIKVGKQTFKSAPIAIDVNKRGSSKSSSISKFFIEAEIDNGSPFRGEQVTLTYTLYTQVDVTSFDEELPKYKGFWTEEIFSPNAYQSIIVRSSPGEEPAELANKIQEELRKERGQSRGNEDFFVETFEQSKKKKAIKKTKDRVDN